MKKNTLTKRHKYFCGIAILLAACMAMGALHYMLWRRASTFAAETLAPFADWQRTQMPGHDTLSVLTLPLNNDSDEPYRLLMEQYLADTLSCDEVAALISLCFTQVGTRGEFSIWQADEDKYARLLPLMEDLLTESGYEDMTMLYHGVLFAASQRVPYMVGAEGASGPYLKLDPDKEEWPRTTLTYYTFGDQAPEAFSLKDTVAPTLPREENILVFYPGAGNRFEINTLSANINIEHIQRVPANRRNAKAQQWEDNYRRALYMQFLTTVYYYTRASALYSDGQPDLNLVFPTELSGEALEGTPYTPEELKGIMEDAELLLDMEHYVQYPKSYRQS